MAQANNNGGK
jgi:NAD(P)-dependent dehydrogenase (short-subunit alcohol dehydrogenase family)